MHDRLRLDCGQVMDMYIEHCSSQVVEYLLLSEFRIRQLDGYTRREATNLKRLILRVALCLE